MIKIFLMVIFCFPVQVQSAEGEYIYLLSNYKSSKFIKHNSYKDKNGDVILSPATFSMTFNIIERLQGGGEFNENVLSFNLNVNSDVPFTMSNGVVLVVKKIKEEKYELLDWDFVGKVFCIEQNLVSEEYAELYFRSPQKGDENKMCRFL